GNVRRARSRRLFARAFSLLGVVVLLGSVVAAPPPIRAAEPSLTLVTDARYDVRPSEKRVAVSVDILATNHLVDTAQNRYFFEQAYLAVQPGASGFNLTSTGLRPKVSV